MGEGRHPARRRQALSRVPSDRAYLLVPAGAQGPGFLMLQNFRAIMKYNPAEAYAMAIGHLADRLRGGEPFVSRGRAMSGCCRGPSASSCNSMLARRGFDVGEPDGRLGAKTRLALREFQAAVGLGAGRFCHRPRCWTGCGAV